MSVWHLVSLLFLFRVRCCSPPARLSPGARRAQTLFPILLGTHTLTHSHVTHRHTSSRAPAPPRSLIYSYLMLRCHNSLSGSLAWQPFVRRCSRGGKRNPAAYFSSFSPHRRDGICLLRMHGWKQTYNLFLSSRSVLRSCRRGEGHKVDVAAPPCPHRALKDPAEKSRC